MPHPPYSTNAESTLYGQGEEKLSGLREGSTVLASYADIKEHYAAIKSQFCLTSISSPKSKA